MCRMAHFGNCDPETADQEYCIFHKPDKTEEEAREFWKKFFERFGPKVEKREINGRRQKVLVFERPINAMGFVFPEMPSQPIEMPRGWKFCNRQYYPECIDFRGAIFDDYVNFYRAVFEDEISFENTVFKEDVLFSKAFFKKLVLFNGCSFNGKGNKLPKIYTEIAQVDPFDDILSVIDNTEAEDPENINISTAFIKTVFEETASFFDATFEGSILFDMAEFQKGAIFDKVQFKGFLTSFRGIKVYSSPDRLRFEIGLFSDTKYDAYHQEFNSGISFIDAEFFGARVKFERAVINLGTQFQRCNFHSEEVNFHKATFNGETRFNDAIFKGDTKFWECKFNGRSEFYRAKFQGKQTSFARSTFKDVAAFEFAEFGKTLFNFATFEKGVSFKNAMFYDEALFRETKFKEPVEFHSAVFVGDARFESTFFESIAEFPKAIFLQSADFNGAIFNNKADFSRTFFNGDAIFRDVAFRVSVDFSDKPAEKKLREVLNDERLKKTPALKKVQINLGYKFGGKVDFSHASVTAMKFVELDKTPLDSHDYRILVQEFVGLFRISEAIIESARIQRVSFEKEGKRDEADKMFVLEMRTRRRVRSKKTNMKIQNFLEWLIGDLPSEYGTNWRQVIWLSLLVVLYFGIAYWLEILSYSFYIGWDIEWFKWLDLGMFWTLFGVSYLVVLYYRCIFENITTLEDFISGIRRYWKYWAILLSPTYLAWIIFSNLSLPFSARVLNKATIQLSNNVIVALNPENPGSVLGTFLNALYYSLVTFTTLGYGDMHPTGWLKALSAIEALTGAVFMALIVAVIARKWMR